MRDRNEMVVIRNRNEMVLLILFVPVALGAFPNFKPYIVEVKPKCERIKNVYKDGFQSNNVRK